MTPVEKIDFRVSRDVGQVYNTAFRFMRQNKRVLFQSVTYYIMPFILVAGFLIFSGISDFIFIAAKGIDGNWVAFGLSVLQGIAGAVICYVAYTAYITLIYEFMRLYQEAENPSIITHKDVWRATRKRFWMGLVNVLVWGVLVSILSGVAGFIFYIFFFLGALLTLVFSSPIIIGVFYIIMYLVYIGVMFYLQSLSFPMVFISAIDRVDIFSAFGRTFSMVNKKGSILNALGSSFLGAAILRILHTNMVTLPIGIVAGVLAYNGVNIEQAFTTENIWFIILFKVVAPICTVLYFYTLSIYFITQAFETLNLDERYQGRGLLARIAKLGTRKDIGPEYYDITY